MIDKAFCEGCIHWRSVGWKNPKSNLANRVCHYLLDTGKSRIKSGNTVECSLRTQRVGFVMQTERAPQHKFDLKPQDVEKIKKHHSGGRKLSFSADQAKALISEGKTDEEAANKLGVNLRTFKDWRLRNKIQGHRKRSWTWSKKRGGENA